MQGFVGIFFFYIVFFIEYVSLFLSQKRTELLSKEYKTARLSTSNKRKETNTTHTDEDKIINNPENDAGSSLEPV